MEEEREQPVREQAEALNVAEEQSVDSEAGSQSEKASLGKFKSVEALLDAYNTLQAKFTQKCQMLSEIEKDKMQEKPKENLEDKFQAFLSEFTDAQGYAEAILEKVKSDDKLQSIDAPFEVAWAKILYENATGKREDAVLDKYVLSNDRIKTKVVENYLQQLKEQKTPITITSQTGLRVSGVKPDTPSTLAEAKAIVDKMFS